MKTLASVISYVSTSIRGGSATRRQSDAEAEVVRSDDSVVPRHRYIIINNNNNKITTNNERSARHAFQCHCHGHAAHPNPNMYIYHVRVIRPPAVHGRRTRKTNDVDEPCYRSGLGGYPIRSS